MPGVRVGLVRLVWQVATEHLGRTKTRPRFFVTACTCGYVWQLAAELGIRRGRELGHVCRCVAMCDSWPRRSDIISGRQAPQRAAPRDGPRREPPLFLRGECLFRMADCLHPRPRLPDAPQSETPENRNCNDSEHLEIDQGSEETGEGGDGHRRLERIFRPLLRDKGKKKPKKRGMLVPNDGLSLSPPPSS